MSTGLAILIIVLLLSLFLDGIKGTLTFVAFLLGGPAYLTVPLTAYGLWANASAWFPLWSLLVGSCWLVSIWAAIFSPGGLFPAKGNAWRGWALVFAVIIGQGVGIALWRSA